MYYFLKTKNTNKQTILYKPTIFLNRSLLVRAKWNLTHSNQTHSLSLYNFPSKCLSWTVWSFYPLTAPPPQPPVPPQAPSSATAAAAVRPSALSSSTTAKILRKKPPPTRSESAANWRTCSFPRRRRRRSETTRCAGEVNGKSMRDCCRPSPIPAASFSDSERDRLSVTVAPPQSDRFRQVSGIDCWGELGDLCSSLSLSSSHCMESLNSNFLFLL